MHGTRARVRYFLGEKPCNGDMISKLPLFFSVEIGKRDNFVCVNLRQCVSSVRQMLIGVEKEKILFLYRCETKCVL